MSIFQPHLGVAVLSLVICTGASVNLDSPTDAEATAAYRAIPAVQAASKGKQEQTVHVTACQPAVKRPGVVCQAQVKSAPQARAEMMTIQFARGPDSAWVATAEQ